MSLDWSDPVSRNPGPLWSKVKDIQHVGCLELLQHVWCSPTKSENATHWIWQIANQILISPVWWHKHRGESQPKSSTRCNRESGGYVERRECLFKHSVQGISIKMIWWGFTGFSVWGLNVDEWNGFMCGVLVLPCGWVPHTVRPNPLYLQFFISSCVVSGFENRLTILKSYCVN